jgi:drug/metabolite transporter (DMT)-like permease
MTAALAPRDADLPRAVLYATGAIGLFTVMGGMVKWLIVSYPLSQIIFCRNLFALLPLLPFIVQAGVGSLRTSRPGGHVLRCGIGLASMITTFWSLAYLPLANQTAIGFAAPLFVTVLAALFLGETMRWRRTVAVIVGFGGVLLMVRPDGDGFFGDGRFVGSLLALFSTVTYAIVLVIIRRLSTTESSITIAFWFTITGLVASGLVLPFEFVAPVSLLDAGLFLAMGLLGGVAQILMTGAYRWGPASIVAPFDYSGMLWALAIGWAVWGELPTVDVLLGATVVIASGLYILHRESVLGVAKDQPPKPRVPAP